MVFADRQDQPELCQAKHAYAPVRFEALDVQAGQLRITNEINFTDLDELAGQWSVSRDGKVVHREGLTLSLPPRSAGDVTLPVGKVALRTPGEYFLEIAFSLKEDASWAKAGHEIAFAQFPLATRTRPKPDKPGAGLRLSETQDEIRVQGGQFAYTFNKRSGRLSSLQIRGRETLVAGPRLNLWRAPILNELQNWGEVEARDWYDIGLDMLEETVDTVYVERESPGEIVISISTRASAPRFTAGYKNSYQYHISADGTIIIEYTGTPFGAFLVRWLPRFGLQLRLQEDIDHFEWFGRSPFETYPDRKTGARIGRFSIKVSDQYVPYIVPQDQGNRTEVRWASLTDKNGVGLKVSADFPMNVSVTTIANFDRAFYPFQLEEAGAVILNIDYSITGVGGTPIPVRPQYRTYPQQYRFSIQLEPLF